MKIYIQMPAGTENSGQQFAQRLIYRARETRLKGEELLRFFSGIMDALDSGADLETAILETEFLLNTINID